MTGRFALIIGNSDYDDQTLAQRHQMPMYILWL